MAKDSHARISSEAVEKRTGKTWDEWIVLLDAAGAKTMTHQQIVALLAGQHGLGPWWQQMVTVGYEQASGLRAKNERPDGYQIGRSKTIAASLAEILAAWKDKRRRGQWLADTDFTIRKATAGKSLRITWIDGETNLEVMLYDKGPGKSQITINHSRIKSAAEAEKMKAYWGKQLDQLKALLEKDTL